MVRSYQFENDTDLVFLTSEKMGDIEGLNQFPFDHFIHLRTPLKKAAENTVKKVPILRASLILKDREMCICIEWLYIVYVYDIHNQSQTTF